MSPGDLLVLVATVVGSGGSGVEIDRGLVDGVQPGDRATVYYELRVDAEPQRIEVGAAVVRSASQERAVVEPVGEVEIRVGYRAELRVPVERALTLLTGEAAATPRPQRTVPQRAAVVAPRPDLAQVASVEIDAGRYEIGLPPDEATFYNHQPRFSVELDAFRLDRQAVRRRDFEQLLGRLDGAATYATLVSFDEAARYCAAAGRRLPTEFEWEVGMRHLLPAGWAGIFEWTDAWYQPYPGNARAEPEYGETYRVLRGGLDSGGDQVYRRRYLTPGERHEQLGFRCAEDAANGP